MTPFFSIITATKNSEAFVSRVIASVVMQTNINWEHIFIDGNSTDRTREIIAEYQRKYPDQVRMFSKQPRGISAAMNDGAREARGEYIIHLHADDALFSENVLDQLSHYIEAREKPDWVYGKIMVLNNAGERQGEFPRQTLWQQHSTGFGKWLLGIHNFIPHQAVCIKKNVFQRYGYFDESLTSAMDPDFWYRIKDTTVWSFVPVVVSFFQLHEQSQTGSKKNMFENNENTWRVRKKYLSSFEQTLARMVDVFLQGKHVI